MKPAKENLISFRFLFFSLMFILMNLYSSATHISGSDITYRWISGNSFEVTLTLYRDCSGIAAPVNPTISYSSASCGYALTATLTAVAGTGQEITQPCSTATTTCTGGTNPGIQQWQYTGIVTLPAQCTDWRFSYSICCRNCAITTLSFTNCNTVPGMTVNATLNNVAAPHNSSPVFTSLPVTFVCIGQPFVYNQGTTDANGDSVVYSLVRPLDEIGNLVNYRPGFSSTIPISSSPAMTISNTTGTVYMTPTATEVAVMAILVQEYRNGVLIGSVIRDMQIWTQPCTNIVPSASGINGTTNYNMVACPGSPISFTVNSVDPNSTQNVTMFWNNGIPGATFTLSGGSRPTGTFNWFPTAAQASTNPYVFTVTVRDDNCPIRGYQTFSYSIIVPPITATTVATATRCASPGTGTASMTTTAISPYTFSWSPGGATTSSITNLTAGFYTVTVTDRYGCTTTSTVAVNGPAPVTANLISSTNIACAGQNNGSASVNAGGGIPPYTYSWSPSGGNGASASNLAAGSYNVTVSDFNGCSQTVAVSITAPPLLTVTPSRTNIRCNGDANGTASVLAAGGVGPYLYEWNPGSINATSLTGLNPGTYTATVTDANGCVQTSSATITQPAILTTSSSVTQATCGAANGAASVSASGGASPYTYSWSPGGSTASSISNISGGSYTATVTDANGCTVTEAIGISNAGGPSVNVLSTVNVSCNGGSNGSASVSASGVAPFTYQWSPTGTSGMSASNLPAGSYTVTVRDANNCVSSVPIDILEPPALIISPSVTDINCFGQNTGAASVSVSGGNFPYSYSWSNGRNTSGISNMAAGNYSVTVTDQNGCTITQSLSIAQPVALTSLVNTSNVSCFNGNNGSASVDINGGSVPYTYAWSGGLGTSSAAAGMTAGNYSVLVTDANNCTITVPVSIQQPTLLNSVIGPVTNIRCNGGNNGSAAVNASGGTAPVTYAWSPSGGSATSASNLTAGTYSVVVTDAFGCTATAAVSITEPQPLALTVTGPTNVSCFGGADGSAAINPAGGLTPYVYAWTPSVSSSSSATGLTAGTYNVLVTDANGCTQTSLISVNQPAAVAPVILSSTNITCNGGNDGSATVDVTGGTGNFTYQWSPSGGSSLTANGLSAGSYVVTATDDNGCSATTSVLLTQPTPVTLSTSVVSSTCGNANGSASVSGSGGSGIYFYSWNTATGGNSLSNVSAGTYTVTATDGSGCSATSSVTITNIAGPIATITNSTPVSCFNGTDGSALAAPTGGTAPFSYAWSSATSSGTAISNLAAGSYIVTITDVNGCISSASVTITQPAILTSAINASTDILCNGGNNGSTYVIPSGGTSPYAFSWSPSGGSASTASSLTAGTYTVIVTDANGCTVQTTSTLTEPAALVVNTSTVTGTCNLANGTATVLPSGGTGPYSYLWQGGSVTATATGLAAGSYNVTVTDVNNCSITTSATVSNHGTFSLAQNAVTPVSCFGRADGTASVNTTGGLAPFSYSWSPNGGSNATATGLAANTYTVTVTDGYNCVQSVSVTVSQPTLLTAANAVQNNVRCFNGNDGSALVTPAGGTGPYSYNWAPGGYTTASVNTLSNGNYTVLITDNNGCTAQTAIPISQPAVLALSSSSSPAGCNQSNGSASVSVTGGTNPYSYSWNIGQNTSTANNVAAGTYVATVTDANNCTSSLSVGVNNFGGPVVAINSVTPVSCFSGANGTASVQVTGSGPFTYQWSPSGGSNAAANNLAAGNYTVSVRDVNNCISTVPVTVIQPVALAATTNTVRTNCFGSADGSASIAVNGGTSPYTYLWSNGNASSTAAGLSAGTYSVTVTDANSCTYTSSVTVSQPVAINVSATADSVTCAGGNNGSLLASANGGSGTFTYAWSSGSQNALAASLTAGTYTVIATDANNCTSSYSATVLEPSPVALQTSTTITRCHGSADGTAIVQATGGHAPYTYQWSNGQVTQTATALLAGNYQVMVTDNYGCTASITAAVPDNIALLSSASSAPVRCYNGSDGSATVTATGGTSPYQYSWSNTAVSATANGLAAGTYSVTVTDANGCMTNTTATVVQPTPLVSFINPVSTVCIGQNATLNVQANGGTPPYSFNWNNGFNDAQQIVTINSNSTFSVVVSDANGCSVPASISVNVHPALLVVASPPDTICQGESVVISATANGGNGGPYSYTWDNGSVGNSITVTPQQTGWFIVNANDNCGTPPAQSSVHITVLPVPQFNLSNIAAEGCIPLRVQFQPNGQLTNSIFYWTFGDGTSSTDPNPVHYYTNPGNYSISLEVQTSDGCTSRKTIAGGIKAYPLPEARFSADPILTTIYNPVINFFDESINAVQWQWSFGDSSAFSLLRNPSHTYQDTGEYEIQLIAISNRGCLDTAYTRIRIDGEFAMYVPNAFTPNSDNVNDFFKPLGIGITKAEMYIYDRWGLKIYYSEDISKGWDGKISDNECQADVYVYKINVIDLNDKPHHLIGHVTLVR